VSTEPPGPPATPPPAADAPPTRGGRLGALQQRDFRLLWLGMVASQTGSWMQQITQNWLLWELTHSPLALGVYGLCRSLPFVAVSLYAGAVADRVDRRWLIIVSNAINAIFPLTVGTLVALGRIEPWHLYLAGALSAVVDSFDLPARQALIPAIVPRNSLMGALALTSTIRRGTGLVGPSLGGLMILWVGAAGAFFVHSLGFVAVMVAAIAMRARPVLPAPTGHALAMVREGLGYVAHHRLLGTMLGVEAVITLCTSYQSIMPVFADTILGVGPGGLGLLISAPGLGAVLGAVGLASRGDVQDKGRILMLSGLLFGVALVAFAMSSIFVLSLVLLVAVGLLDAIYGAVRNTIVQLAVTDRFRGRVMGLHSLTQRGLGPSGNFITGGLATVVGAPGAVALLAIFATSLVVWRSYALPALRDFGEGERPLSQ
jgi:hypothetical protein